MEDLSYFNPEGSTLRKHQMKMVEILCVIDKICKKHKINYWLSSGTLLGAVRHHGFIPWDDDLDIEMLAEDYKRFLSVIQSELPNDLVLQPYKTDPNYVAPYVKIRDTKSCLYETSNKDCNYMYRGIYIDVFYIEPSTRFLIRVAMKLHGYLYKLSYRPCRKGSFLFYSKRLILVLLQNCVYPLFRVVSKFLHCKKLYQCLGAGFLGERNKKDLFPLSAVSFEGKTFPAPHDPDAYLTRLYGNYMQLPDLSRIEVHLDKIEFGK